MTHLNITAAVRIGDIASVIVALTRYSLALVDGLGLLQDERIQRL